MKHPIRRALLSVSDKRGLAAFARQLRDHGVELLATGGTRRLLEQEGVPTREVAEVTGFPEMMDGRVKTLHPLVHGGILALREEPSHVAAMEAHGIPAIDLVVVNLYPFEETRRRAGATRAEIVEQIDIGGPSMVRSAAKNHAHVGVVTDPDDYGRVLDELQRNGGALGDDLRRELARKAFALTARYDAAIGRWLLQEDGGEEPAFPASFSLAGGKVGEDLRYGENPHQRAAFYASTEAEAPCLATAEFLGGKALSYNNLVDLDAALGLAREFRRPFVCVMKHNNPCGAASEESLPDALAHAWEGDPLSAYGSVLALNRPVDRECAEFLVSGGRFVEAIVAPSFAADAVERLRGGARWGKNVRLLAVGPIAPPVPGRVALELKPLAGGFLVQTADDRVESSDDLRVVTKRQPTDEEVEGMIFAAVIAKHVRSNAIVLAKGSRVVGVGAGQMSRVDAVHLAARKAGDKARGAALGSDAFFPFPDGVETAMEAGVTAFLQPGGSIRDDQVVAAVDARGGTMALTGVRHFRH